MAFLNFIIKKLPSVIIFFICLIFIIAYARGYRINFSQKKIQPTGILIASSYPDGAKIFLNGKFYGATNTQINLPPGHYFVEIKKEGYSSWQKKITIKGELVVKAEALLFPLNPSLSPITNLGINKAFFHPSSAKVILFSKSENEEKNGIYALETGKKPVSLFNPLKPLILKTRFPEIFSSLVFESLSLKFSPEGKEFILSGEGFAYLVNTEEENKELFDVRSSLSSLNLAWQEIERKQHLKILETFKEPIQKIATDSFKIISFSPDETKIFYQAKKNILLPLVIKPPLIGANQTSEERDLKEGNFYVYDKKEDKNFRIDIDQKFLNQNLDISTIVLWYPDSLHLLINEGNQISIVDYDGENKRTVYSGPFEKEFFGVTSEGKLLILTNLNPKTNKLADVYIVGIR